VEHGLFFYKKERLYQRAKSAILRKTGWFYAEALIGAER
jgi:hypothetical protein